MLLQPRDSPPLVQRAETLMIPFFAKASPLALARRAEALMIPLFAKASPLALARRAEARKAETAGT